MDEPQSTGLQKLLHNVAAYDNDFKKWEARAQKIIKRYRDDNRSQNTNETAKFNILWSNVQTLIPAVYARLPKADVSRRFGDNDQVGRVASLLIERALDFEIEHYPDFRSTMKHAVEDRFLTHRSATWQSSRQQPFKASRIALLILSGSGFGSCGLSTLSSRFFLLQLAGIGNFATTITATGPTNTGQYFVASAIRRLYSCTGWLFGMYTRTNSPRAETLCRGCGTGVPGISIQCFSWLIIRCPLRQPVADLTVSRRGTVILKYLLSIQQPLCHQTNYVQLLFQNLVQ